MSSLDFDSPGRLPGTQRTSPVCRPVPIQDFIRSRAMITHRISIRDVPEDAARELAAAAAVRGPSVQGYFKTRVVVAPALLPDPDTQGGKPQDAGRGRHSAVPGRRSTSVVAVLASAVAAALVPGLKRRKGGVDRQRAGRVRQTCGGVGACRGDRLGRPGDKTGARHPRQPSGARHSRFSQTGSARSRRLRAANGRPSSGEPGAGRSPGLRRGGFPPGCEPAPKRCSLLPELSIRLYITCERGWP